MTTSEGKALNVAKSFVDALSRRDPDGMLPLLDENFVMEAAYPLVEGEDKAGARRCGPEFGHTFFRNVANSLASIKFNDVAWRTTNDGLVLFEAVGEMHYPDGREYNNVYLWFFRVSNGKISWLKEYFSPVIWARANGLTLDDLP